MEVVFQKWMALLMALVALYSAVPPLTAGHQVTSLITESQPPYLSRLAKFYLYLLRFPNIGCQGNNGDSGLCFKEKECQARGGTNIASCASGLGVCCYTEMQCGGSSSLNCTYILSPNYPDTYNEARTCTFNIVPMSGTCSIRLDFVEFQSTQPNNAGVCQNDQFTVPGERKFQYLCGNSPPNWHFYLDVPGRPSTPDPVRLVFNTDGTNFERKFKIKVTHIMCLQKIPTGCGQYFQGDTGTIQSFNYGGPYIAGVNYGICTRKEKNRCSSTLTRGGPSFVSCSDLYRQPIGQAPTVTGIEALDNFVPYCNINFGGLENIPSTSTTVTRGPLTLWHQSLLDLVPNGNPVNPAQAGFWQTFTHNAC